MRAKRVRKRDYATASDLIAAMRADGAAELDFQRARAERAEAERDRLADLLAAELRKVHTHGE